MSQPGGGSAVHWVDSHCHLQWLTGGADAALDRAREAGVHTVICVGTDLESSRIAVERAAEHPEVWATVGLHPHDASNIDEEWDALVALAGSERVVGIGEAGFDFHYTHSPPPEQDEAFRRQIRLAHELDRTLVIHSREAWDATFAALDDEGAPSRTVFHCFTGGPGEARRALELGAYLSFSGIVSFRNAEELREAVALAPVERVLVETDAPYLAPMPYRGRENEPAYLPAVGAAVAAATGREIEAVAESTAMAAHQAFRLS